jgi:hypothetical protein
VPLLTGDSLTTATTFVQENTERETLEQLADGELLRKAAREVVIAVYMVANALMRQASILVTRPADTTRRY